MEIINLMSLPKSMSFLARLSQAATAPPRICREHFGGGWVLGLLLEGVRGRVVLQVAPSLLLLLREQL